MKAQQWLEAHRAGAIFHEWAELDLSDRVRVRVSADAPRVGGIDGVREGAGANGSQLMADALGAHMLTAVLVERRHVNASVLIEPITLEYTSPAVDHSDLIDDAIQGAIPFTGWGDAPSQGRALHQLDVGTRTLTWLVSNTCKPFVLDPKCTNTVGVNHGWLVHKSQVAWNAKLGKHVWKRAGIPVYPAVWAPDHYVIQLRGAAHNHFQDDYASAPLFIHERCLIDGEDAPTEVLFTNPKWCALVTPDGQPFKHARHPGVERVDIIVEREIEPPKEEPAAWADSSLPHGERVAAWLLHHEGHAEDPPGSNTSPLIDKWAEFCTRDVDNDGDEDPLGRDLWTPTRGTEWCAVTWSAAVLSTLLPGETIDFTARVSMDELKRDAIANGTFVPLDDVLSGKVEPQPGWAVLWPRFDPGTTNIGWRGHVDGWLGWANRAGKVADVIGGNVGNKVTRRSQPLLNGKLSAYGFVRLDIKTEPLRNTPVSLEGEYVEGVDVAWLQTPSTLDYEVLSKRFGWAIVKFTQGVSRDRHAVEHAQRFRAAGMRVGGYHFLEPDIPWKAQWEAFKRCADDAGYGRVGDIVPMLDIERWREPFDAKAHNERGRRIAQEMATWYGGCGIYSNEYTLASMGHPEWMEEHALWLASETSKPQPTGPARWSIWQWTAQAGVAGANVKIDLNRARHLPLIEAA